MTNQNTNPLQKTAVIIVAGGTGTRAGGHGPKQYRQLHGHPLLIYAMRYFAALPQLQQIVVVVPLDQVYSTMELVSKYPELQAPDIAVVAGGARRQDSVMAGITAATHAEYVAVHDAARPFPPHNFLECLDAAIQTGAAIFATPVSDTLKQVSQSTIEKSVPRQHLWAAQTPQVFHREKLIHALEVCHQQNLEITDDASAFEHLGWPVTIIPGNRQNLKVTYPEDFTMAEALLKGQTQS